MQEAAAIAIQPRFRAGQVVMYDSQSKKRSFPALILEVIGPDEYGDFFYRIDRKNCFHESMLRELSEAEKGAQ